MGILAWIVFGLIAGVMAKWLMPGDDPGGFVVTTLIGIGGAVVGGFISSAVLGLDVTGFNLTSFLVAIGGSLLLLFGYRKLKAR